MPSVESYQRIDLQIGDESSRQINKKSLDQAHGDDYAHSEAHIENRSVRNTIEDTSLALSNTNAGQGSEVVIAAPLTNGNASSASNAIDGVLVVHPQTTARQSEGLNASVNVGKGVSDDNSETSKQPVDQFSDARANLSDGYYADGYYESAMRHEGVHKRNQNHMREAILSSGSSKGVGATDHMSVKHSTNPEDDALIEIVNNLTVEQAFDFLTEQTEDNHVSLS